MRSLKVQSRVSEKIKLYWNMAFCIIFLYHCCWVGTHTTLSCLTWYFLFSQLFRVLSFLIMFNVLYSLGAAIINIMRKASSYDVKKIHMKISENCNFFQCISKVIFTVLILSYLLWWIEFQFSHSKKSNLRRQCTRASGLRL